MCVCNNDDNMEQVFRGPMCMVWCQMPFEGSSWGLIARGTED